MDETEINLIEKLNKLSSEIKEIVLWIADNIDFVNQICREKVIQKEKWERYMEHAKTEIIWGLPCLLLNI